MAQRAGDGGSLVHNGGTEYHPGMAGRKVLLWCGMRVGWDGALPLQREHIGWCLYA